MTWNLRSATGQLGSLVNDLRAGRLTNGIPPREVALLLQEASAETRVDGLHAFLAPVRRVEGAEQGNAILSSLPLTNARAIELPRERQRRVAAMATVPVAGVDLLLVNVHLENRTPWWKGGLPADRGRARQMEALLAQLPEGPGVLGGDLNTWLGTRERAYQVAAARFPDAIGQQRAPTFRDRLVLDHLFFRLPAGWRAFHQRAPNRFGSDHHPVVGVLVSH